MSDFKIAFNKTMVHEGGYANDSVDTGGETYRGISRRSFPKWDGWLIIDEVKKSNPKFIKEVINALDNVELNNSVENLYKKVFWDSFRGDEIPFQKIANILFDSSVNMGQTRPIKFLQKTLNSILPGIKLKEDGIYGKGTHSSLMLCVLEEKNRIALVEGMINKWRNFYYVIVNNNPSQKKFLNGWLRRVKDNE